MADTAKPFTRWTADTQTAFLLALRLHGTVRAAAGAIGRLAGSAYRVRERDADFAARWTAVVGEMQAEWIARAERAAAEPGAAREPRIGRERCDGWTEARRTRFAAMLARGGSVAEAAAAVGLSTTAAYRHRRRSARFAAAWDHALAEQGMTPIEAAYARAVDGWDEPVVFQGKVVAVKRRYSDAALRLLIQRDEKRAASAAAQAAKREGIRYAKPDDTDRAILTKLAAIEARRARAAREEAVAFAERMRGAGWAP